MDWVIIDLETTGLSPDIDEIIEIAAVRWADGKPADTFQTLVRPVRRVPSDILRLTGIDEEELRVAPALDEVWPRFLGFIAGRTAVGQNLSFDLGFLRSACDNLGYDLPLAGDGVDTQVLARILYPGLHEYSLAALAAQLSIEPQPVHRALADVLACGGLLQRLEQTAEMLPWVTLQELAHLASTFSSATASWFAERAERRRLRYGEALPAHCDKVQSLVFSARGESTDGAVAKADAPSSDLEVDASASNNGDLAAHAAWLLGPDSPLRRVLPSFQARPGQLRMVEAVAHALEQDEHLIVEAGTGTGKSLAYLIPSVLYARRNDTRVVVSTHTVALQDQIRDRDFPTLRMVLGDEISLAVFKGRNHYVCMRKLEHEAGAIGFGSPADETIAVMAYLRWLVDTREGMREELSMRGAMNTVWARVQSESETCIGKRCPFFKPCFYFRARARAHEADVVVTNHSLVFADLRADHRILPRYNKLVFDEAHHLEEQATQHLGEEIQFARCITVLTRLVRDNRQHGLLPELSQRLTGTHVSAKVLPILDRVAARVTGLRPMLDAVFGTVAALIPPGETVQRFDEACTRRREWSTFISAVHEVTDYMGPLADDYDELLHLADEMEGDLDVTGGRLLDACGLLRELIEQVAVLQRATVHDDMWVVWAEKGGSDARSVSVRRAPLDVAHLLKERLFANKQTVILTSATLSVNGNFSFVQRQLGLEDGADKRVATLMVESPFDIAGQALLCIPSDVPDLAGIPIEDASRWLTASLERLAAVSQGRMLVLFTSHALLRAVAQRIREPLRRMGLRLYAQGVDGNRSKILDAFRSEPASVLFGAQSFWEGIDLPGDQLTTLAIVRLPFAPPTHPVAQARAERIERSGQSAFWQVSLPEAVVRFRQGFGRLIRTIDDRGVVVVYDKRIITARYGQVFLRSLPNVRPVVAREAEVVEQVGRFLRAESGTAAAQR